MTVHINQPAWSGEMRRYLIMCYLFALAMSCHAVSDKLSLDCHIANKVEDVVLSVHQVDVWMWDGSNHQQTVAKF